MHKEEEVFDSFLDEIEDGPLPPTVAEKKESKANDDKNSNKKINLFGKDKKKELKWRIKFAVWNLEKRGDLDKIESVYTRAAHSTKEKGVRILSEDSQFCVDGSYKTVVSWGEYESVEKEAI